MLELPSPVPISVRTRATIQVLNSQSCPACPKSLVVVARHAMWEEFLMAVDRAL